MKTIEVLESKEDVFHLHCESCINIKKCLMRGWMKCDIISCNAGCGAKYHSCKGQEHALICSSAWVPCINVAYGCPKWMPRRQQGVHLELCPASVVMCTMEWNRWPIGHSIHTIEKPRTFNKCNIPYEQLDVSLAFRDQQMLQDSLHLPPRTHEAFCNSLTSQHPAVPLLLQGECSTNSAEDRAPPGLKKSVCSTLCNSWDKQQCMDEKGGLVTFNGVKISTGASTCLNGLHLLKPNSVTNSETQCICSNGSCGFAKNNKMDTSESYSVAKSIFPLDITQLSSTSSLWLDLSLESITKYQSKPKAMYTFLCAQEFRRDEFPWHYKNVHSDVHGGLDGWLEHRCPLAHYGCPYSQRRLQPLGKGSKVLFNKQLRCFGVVPPEVESSNREESQMECDFATYGMPLNLTQLPFEVLRHVTQFLDSFSLCNLSMTCHSLRTVCASLLEEKGMVRHHWQKGLDADGKVTWTLGHKHWAFSTSFSGVRNWGYVENEHMANHMKHCKYLDRVVHKQQTKILYFPQEE